MSQQGAWPDERWEGQRTAGEVATDCSRLHRDETSENHEKMMLIGPEGGGALDSGDDDELLDVT